MLIPQGLENMNNTKHLYMKNISPSFLLCLLYYCQEAGMSCPFQDPSIWTKNQIDMRQINRRG